MAPFSLAFGRARAIRLGAVLSLTAFALTGCSSSPQKSGTQTENPAAAKPAVPEEVQDVARSLLGSETEVLLHGDLAKTGKQQVFAANVVPNTPKSTVAGTVVTRAVIAENDNGKWTELFRCDEHLKNQKGFLAGTPLQAVSGWRVQYENDPNKGLVLYFTPVQAGTSQRTLPIAVKWNPKANRYQSMDMSYEHFLTEAASLENPRRSARQ